MSQPIVYEYTAWQRKHLRLILQTTKRRRKHQSVIISLEITAIPTLGIVIILKAESLIAYQPLPCHSIAHEILIYYTNIDIIDRISHPKAKKWEPPIGDSHCVYSGISDSLFRQITCFGIYTPLLLSKAAVVVVTPLSIFLSGCEEFGSFAGILLEH